MKKCCFLFLFLIVFLLGKAQVLDTVSLKAFEILRHKQIKALYNNDEDALEIIQNNQTRKINAYVFFGLAVPFAVTANPSIWIPLTPAFIKLSNNTRKSLYNKLLYYERIKYNKDTIKMKVSVDTNSTNYLYANYKFEITLDEFKALNKKQQLALLNINDTTQYIFDYSYNYEHSNYGKYILSGISLNLGVMFLMTGVASYLEKGYEYQIPMIFGTGAGIVFTTIGVLTWPNKKELKKMDSQYQIYNNLQQYYLTHKVYPDVAKYIKKRRDYYKPKPLLN